MKHLTKLICVFFGVLLTFSSSFANTDIQYTEDKIVDIETITYETCMDGFRYGVIENIYTNPDGSIDVDTQYTPLLVYTEKTGEYKRIPCEGYEICN